MKKNSYILVAFVILIFGIWALPKIFSNFNKEELVKFEKVPAFEFTNQNNKTISNADFNNKVYVVVIKLLLLRYLGVCKIFNLSH